MSGCEIVFICSASYQTRLKMNESIISKTWAKKWISILKLRNVKSDLIFVTTPHWHRTTIHGGSVQRCCLVGNPGYYHKIWLEDHAETGPRGITWEYFFALSFNIPIPQAEACVPGRLLCDWASNSIVSRLSERPVRCG